MRKSGGYIIGTGPQGVEDEADTFTCGHCNNIVRVKPMADAADMGGLCRVCDTHICPKCVSTGCCEPFERKLEEQEARYHSLRSMGLA